MNINIFSHSSIYDFLLAVLFFFIRHTLKLRKNQKIYTLCALKCEFDDNYKVNYDKKVLNL